MTFISYGQNFEDVVLWRALKHIENGFYVDVGANDPEHDSVTKSFYDRGWHGINLEPVPEFHKRLVDERPRDLNLAVAAGASDGEITLFDVPAVRGWATSDESVAAMHRSNGYEVITLKVPVKTLTAVCDMHANEPVHFLKIDVEGFETEVIRGMDFRKHRPWVLIIEATLPNSQVTNHAAWEPTLIAADYQFAYFDGLNRYYVALEHAELMQAFGIQPNVFDDFVTIGQATAQEVARAAEDKLYIAEVKAQKEEARAAQAADKTLQAQAETRQARHMVQLKDSEIAAIHASMSWRVTRPLRHAKFLLQEPRQGLQRIRARMRPLEQGVKKLIARGLRWLAARPRLLEFVVSALSRVPALDARVRKFTARIKEGARARAGHASIEQVPEKLKHVPISARKVLADLNRAGDNANS